MGNALHIEAAIRRAGSEAKLGERTGYSQVAINKAKRRGRVSAEMAVAIDRAGFGDKTVLRPDLFVTTRDHENTPNATARQDGSTEPTCGENARIKNFHES